MIKRFRLILIFIVIAYLIMFLTKVPDTSALNRECLIGAHRGDSKDYLENTIKALDAAANDPNYQFIEFDVQLTKDNVPVIYHDQTLLRLYKIPISISETDYGQLKDYNIPTFQQAITTIGKTKPVSIDIKYSGSIERDQRLIRFIILYCKKHHLNFLITSLDPALISYVKQNYPDVKTGINYLALPITYFHNKDITRQFYKHVEADYIFLHDINLRNHNLIDLKPEDKTLGFWDTSDKIFIMSSNIW